MTGKFIVIDGGDGAGKKTQMDLLAERLSEEGRRVETADFPQYGKWSAQFVEHYLNGKFGPLEDIGPKKASLFYALDRYSASAEMHQWLDEGAIVVSNRYVAANKGHQLGKIQDPTQMREFLSWLNGIEYEILGLPVPDLTLFLHMTPEIGQRLVDQKGEREYTQGKKRDLHEEDVDHLRNAERAYLFCVDYDQTEHWERIRCFEKGQPKPVEVIHENVYKIVKEILE